MSSLLFSMTSNDLRLELWGTPPVPRTAQPDIKIRILSIIAFNWAVKMQGFSPLRQIPRTGHGSKRILILF